MDGNWLKSTNEEVLVSIERRDQLKPKVLVLYWETGNVGFKTECQAVREMFEETFHYPTEEFAIPSKNVEAATPNQTLEYELMSRVTKLLSEATHRSTLIIYYGGHGDEDHDKHRGQECQSVWAEFEAGGSTLRWYKIQELMRESSADILLILDCCFAAQAARGRNDRRGRFEILAAAAMGMPTRGPGKKSFTTVLLEDIHEEVAKGGVIEHQGHTYSTLHSAKGPLRYASPYSSNRRTNLSQTRASCCL
ncbi:hypothetical protein PG997_015282 [Apiospora hydei]|uniref:Peptidase C14 caspase domain-containing protein n=1 Tax=Apiospora hydei TaxID=1337664 RepID=A0ABR1UQ70_9PEZI